MESSPLVSVIIPCYNHGHYLSKAIESVLRQSHSPIEIVVVDDGSTDNTATSAQCYPNVTYVHQSNSGLSASRNTGIQHSTGQYLVFLDADDWLYPEALAINLKYLQQNEQMAFVSGAYDMIFINENFIKEEKVEIHSDHYCHLLNRNYIGMIAAVMFQRWVLEEFQYDTSLRACEDYDLYLKISRRYPVMHHTEKIAAYRIHANNMSSNIPMMLNTILLVRKRQEKELKTKAEENAYKQGQIIWKDYYCKQLYQKLVVGKEKVSGADLVTLLRYKPKLLYKYIKH
jgi:glycosyltransferase involved in cell wall biosynthesis